MLNNKDIGVNLSGNTLTVNGRRVELASGEAVNNIAADLGALESRFIFHDFDVDEPLDVNFTGAALLYGYDSLVDPTDDTPEFLYILSPLHCLDINRGAGSITCTKRESGWRITPSDNSHPRIYLIALGGN